MQRLQYKQVLGASGFGLTNGENEVCLAEHTHAWNSPFLQNHHSIRTCLDKDMSLCSPKYKTSP